MRDWSPLLVGRAPSVLPCRLKRWCFPRGPINSASMLVEPLQLLIDSAREFEGISCLKRVSQCCQLFAISLSGFHNPLERGAGRVIAANKSGAFTNFALQLHRGLEQILEDPQLLIEPVDGL